MGTNYPGSNDVFTEPSLPEETSLSSAGSGSRNHVEHHTDLGDAVEALQTHAAQKTHDHSGVAGPTHGSKLLQANTHETPDTNASPSALHHTLGTGANNAAAGNHVHSYNDLTNRPWVICTSSTRPGSPTSGMLIYETDTFRMRVWAQYPGDSVASWRYLLGPLPSCRLRQTIKQKILHTGTILQWQSEVEDSFGMFNSGTSQTNIICKEAGQYQIEAALQWDPDLVPDVANVVLMLNGVETTVRQQQFLRGNVFNPGFSQTLNCVGKLRMAVNDVLTVKASYTAPGGLLNFIFSFFDDPAKINSRLDITFIGP